MKKVLSILLSLCLIFTSISCVLTQSVSAKTIEVNAGTSVDTSAFYTTSNWYFIKNGTATSTIGTLTESTATTATVETSTAMSHDDNGSSLLFNARTHYSTIRFDVEKNKNYSLSYWIYADRDVWANTSQARVLSHSVVLAPDGGFANTISGRVDGTHDFIYDTLSYHSKSGKPKTNSDHIETTAFRTTYSLTGELKTWQKVTHTFNSQDNEEMILTFRIAGIATGKYAYVDDFELISDYHDFEDLSFWGTYRKSTTSNVAIDGSAVVTNSSTTLKYDSTNVVENTNGKSIFTYGQLNNSVVYLPKLNANTKYKLSFKFKTTATCSADWFNTYIIKEGATISSAGSNYWPSEYIAQGPATGVDKTADSNFHDYSMEFTTDDSDSTYMLSILQRAAAANNYYFDEFKLEEIVKTTITFISDGGSDVDPISGYEGDVITMPADPTKDGFEFAGWTYADGTAFTGGNFPADDITVYANWDQIDPNAKFEDINNWALYYNGSSGAFTATPVIDGSNTKTAIGSSSTITIEPSPTDETDNCVKIKGNQKFNALKLSGLEAHTKYTVSLKYYVPEETITNNNNIWFRTYVVESGTKIPKTNSAIPEEYVVSQDEANTSNRLTWNNFTLDFYTGDAGDYFFAIMPQITKNDYYYYFNDITLTKGAALVEVTYDTNSNSEIPSEWVEPGVAMELPEEPTNGDKVFAGWYTDDKFTTKFDGTAEETNFTLYADWADYKVTKGSRIVLNEYKDRLMHEWASYGDKVTFSFKYRLVSGSVNAFYPLNSTTNDTHTIPKAWVTDTETNKRTYSNANGFMPKNIKDQVNVSNSWTTVETEYTVITDEFLKNRKYSTDEEGLDPITPEDFMCYFGLYVTFDTGSEEIELYISDVKFELTGKTESLATAYNDKAAVGTSKLGKTGLRVYNQINKAWTEEQKVKEYGSIVTYKSLIDDEELTLDTVEANKAIKGVAYDSANPENSRLWSDDGLDIVHTSLLLNIPDTRFGETIVIRSYAIDFDNNVYYSATEDNDIVELCIYDIVYAIDNSENTPDAATFEFYVTAENHAAYAAWCATKGKPTGALYADKYGTQQ